ncbi:hypothetical protein AB0H36_11630 [Kribbella sp. NPDC050820]|uniref:hypothetical protein n=1 Tax=Kribbella sp. NPDC050820 TaxID=3155408 RepID=UPI0033E6C6B3
MSPSKPKTAVTAAAVVATTPQPDDAGAQTADRFEWQAAMELAPDMVVAAKLPPKLSESDAGPLDCRRFDDAYMLIAEPIVAVEQRIVVGIRMVGVELPVGVAVG